MFVVPIGGTSAVYLQASGPLWRNWTWVDVKNWKRILWSLLEWEPWVHSFTFHLMTNSLCVILWEHLNVRSSNWGDVSGLFAGELPSLKQLDMPQCENLKTDSMDSIGMRALGKLHHVSFFEEFLWSDFMRGSRYSKIQLGGRQRSICGRVSFFEEIEHGRM